MLRPQTKLLIFFFLRLRRVTHVKKQWWLTYEVALWNVSGVLRRNDMIIHRWSCKYALTFTRQNDACSPENLRSAGRTSHDEGPLTRVKLERDFPVVRTFCSPPEKRHQHFAWSDGVCENYLQLIFAYVHKAQIVGVYDRLRTRKNPVLGRCWMAVFHILCGFTKWAWRTLHQKSDQGTSFWMLIVVWWEMKHESYGCVEARFLIFGVVTSSRALSNPLFSSVCFKILHSVRRAMRKPQCEFVLFDTWSVVSSFRPSVCTTGPRAVWAGGSCSSSNMNSWWYNGTGNARRLPISRSTCLKISLWMWLGCKNSFVCCFTRCAVMKEEQRHLHWYFSSVRASYPIQIGFPACARSNRFVVAVCVDVMWMISLSCCSGVPHL